jgi:hypothetical protein
MKGRKYEPTNRRSDTPSYENVEPGGSMNDLYAIIGGGIVGGVIIGVICLVAYVVGFLLDNR